MPVQDRGDDRQERGDDELCATGTRARSAPRRYSLHTPARWAAEQRDVVCSAKQRALPRHSLLRTLSKMLPRIWKISLKKSDATYVTSPPLPMSKEALSSPLLCQRLPEPAGLHFLTFAVESTAASLPNLASGSRQTRSLLRRVSRPLRAAVSSRPAYQPPLVPSCRCPSAQSSHAAPRREL